jgi:ribonucleoside-diphosphate reductase alpha chain
VPVEPGSFATPVSRFVWESRYRRAGEHGLLDTWRRVARAVAAVEPRDRDLWEERFLEALAGFAFLPGGRILAGAGADLRVTLCNCFVMGPIEDSLPGICEALEEAALTLQAGGGIGCDFSTLRPAGALARGAGTIASGPVSFLPVWDSLCATLLSTGARRGAMMATLRCDHPDIERFIAAKREPGALRHFNLSVLVSDAFLNAVERDEEWPLVFPATALDREAASDGYVLRRWTGAAEPVLCEVLRSVPARRLWEDLQRAAWERGDPGVLFVDRINRGNNLWYREQITATNPCGETPLPAYGACVLGSINLACFVERPFSPTARLDLEGIAATATRATRFLDDVVDVSRYPLPRQEWQAHQTRRIGLGVTGLADALALLGVPYGSRRGLETAALAMRSVCHAAYRASIALAHEKGSFPAFDREPFLAGEFARALPGDVRRGIAERGLRNSHLLAIAPTGTVSLLAGGVSSGIEPLFDLVYRRRILGAGGSPREFEVVADSLRRWRRARGAAPPPADLYVTAARLPAEAHLDMQAALQPFVDQAIAKTVNVQAASDFAAFRDLFAAADARGLKGLTVFRPNPVTGELLRPEPEACCTPAAAAVQEAT